MGLFDNNSNPPPLFVPDLTKPAGAVVDAAGNVTCIACGTVLPLARADVVGQGYRCPPCTAKADLARLETGRSDVGSDLNASDREALRSSAYTLLVPGIGMVLLGAVLLPFLRRAPFYLIAAGISSAGVGYERLRRAR